ncbi:MAG: hypothetical protein JXA20_16715 [Spirochaetes bacterium]|nr:hypothetical protein [Spirochaetota bacterium]
MRLMLPPCLLALLILSPVGLTSQDRERILVLGFDSPCMDDLQDRFLRESMMKQFIALGHPVVSVMSLEELLQQEGIRGIRQAGSGRVKDYCKKMDAEIAISGRIYPLPGRAASKGIQDENGSFLFELVLYRQRSDTIATSSFRFAGNRNLTSLIGELSIRTSREASVLMGR